MKKTLRGQSFVIQGETVEELHLKGNELLIYSLISHYSKGEKVCKGSLSFFQQWTNSDRKTVLSCIQNLLNKGLIVKQTNSNNTSEYKIAQWWKNSTSKTATVVEKFPYCMDSSGKTPLVKGDSSGKTPLLYENGTPIISTNIVKSSLYNKIKKEKTLFTESKRKKEKQESEKSLLQEPKKFKKPTVEELCSYCQERGNGLDGAYIYDFYESKGWKVGTTPMKDWRACVRTWERKSKTLPQKNNTPNMMRRGKETDTRYTNLDEIDV